MASFADQQTYQAQGRQMSSRFGREHSRQQPSVISMGHESPYATDAQLSMSRTSQQRVPRAGAAGRAQGNTGLAAQSGNANEQATVRYAVHQEPAIAAAARPMGPGPARSRATQSHPSTATLAYSPGCARASASGQKRQPADLNNIDAHSAPEEGGYNTRAKRGRTNIQ